MLIGLILQNLSKKIYRNNIFLSGIDSNMVAKKDPRTHSESKDSSSTPLIFTVTENMQKMNIDGLILNGSDFEFIFADGRKRGIPFSNANGSISELEHPKD